MVIAILFAALLLVGLLLFVLGFRLGGDRWHTELVRVRLEAAEAERKLHDITRDAFVSMAERVERRRRK